MLGIRLAETNKMWKFAQKINGHFEIHYENEQFVPSIGDKWMDIKIIVKIKFLFIFS
jgi:hypothetical protein